MPALDVLALVIIAGSIAIFTGLGLALTDDYTVRAPVAEPCPAAPRAIASEPVGFTCLMSVIVARPPRRRVPALVRAPATETALCLVEAADEVCTLVGPMRREDFAGRP